MTRLHDIEPPVYVHKIETGAVLEIVSIDADYPEGVPEGTVTMNRLSDGETVVKGAGGVDEALLEETMRVLNDAVVERPEDILSQFIESEISSYVSRLGIGHPYNGIDGVDTLHGLRAAHQLCRLE